MVSRRIFSSFAIILTWGLSVDATEAPKARSKSELCGWYDNPTPNNATLTDKDGEWLLSEQGSYETTGNWSPSFNIEDESTFVHTNGGSYGYGCVCMKVDVQPDSKKIKKVHSIKIRRLELCRKDKALKNKEPQG